MRRVVPIRITESDKQEYARLVRNSKAKINRTANKYGVDLSSEIKIPEIGDFTSRSEFNEFKAKQKSFTRRSNQNFQFKKNEFGVVATKKELNDIEYNTRKAQRIAEKLRKEAVDKPIISGGKKQGTVGQRMQQMGKPETAGITVPKDFDFEKIRSRKQLEEKKKNMEERSSGDFFDKRMEKYKKNFIELLEQTYNSDSDGLIERLKSIPPDEFYELVLIHEEFTFEYHYTTQTNSEDENSSLFKMENIVENYHDGKINMDLKNTNFNRK